MCLSRVLALVVVAVGLMGSMRGQVAENRAQHGPTTTISQTAPSDNDEPVNSAIASATKAKQTDDDAGYGLLPGEDPDNHLPLPFVKHLASDQRAFWTAPAHFRAKDLRWIAPFAGVTAGFMAGDSWISKQIPSGEIQRSQKISDYGVYSLVGAGAGSFLLGHLTGNDRMSETGLLSGEAAINSTAIAFLLKNITQRPRPFQLNGRGTFFKGGDSFPSEHAAIAWSVASVMAHEYPGTLTRILAYGLATAVSATRVSGQQHFASDAIIGSALGWYFARQVYRAHHDTELGGSGWGPLVEEKTGEESRRPNYMASPYVPLDSWIYPAFERLIALGYVHSAVLGMRPWTRMQCAELLEEAEERFSNDLEDRSAHGLYSALRVEFGNEIARLNGASNTGAQVDSIYTRTVGISGTPLRDGYHFGQTLINDYGRPYWEGVNNITGLTAEAEAGPVSFYFRGEYQHAPTMPSYSQPVLAATAAADFSPPLSNGRPQVNRFQLLDTIASVNINNIQVSFGNQSEWLSPSESGSWLLSNNAAPFPTLKIDNIMPYEISGLSRLLGPMRTEFFIGQLSGQHWEACAVPTCHSFPGYPTVVGPNISPQPLIHGEKISFKPTPNLEFGMGVAAMFGGPGLPITLGTFFHTYYVHTPNLAKNPGKRLSAADFTYRVPGLRNWLTVYMDSMTWDEISPLGSTRANVNPGVYIPRIPKLPGLEFRAEGLNVSRTKEFVPGFVYYNGDRYRSGYINDGNLLGDWIGRAGRGGQGWLTYSFSPRNKVQLGYRLQTVAPNLIGGGRSVDYSATTQIAVRANTSLSGSIQYEQWRFPVLSPARQSDLALSVQLSFYPHWHLGR